jgi:hypothetical protein
MAGAGGQGGAGGMAGAGGGGGGNAKVVLGVTNAPNELFIDADSLHVVARVDGVVIRDVTFGADTAGPLPLPQEVALENLADDALVEVTLESKYAVGQAIRLASTRAVAGRQPLLRVTLSVMGCESCGPGLTCNWGRCLDPFVPPEQLEEYTPDWIKYSWCKPKTPTGAPELALGTGATTFIPADEQTPVQLWSGGQGGHHVYVALRARNLRQSSSAKVTGELVDTGQIVGPVSMVRVFRDDPGIGYCESLGMLFQLDTNLDISNFYGKKMKLTAVVSDNDGASVAATQTIVLPLYSMGGEEALP